MDKPPRKTLTPADLKPADVLLTTAAGAVSTVIRFGTSSKYSHTAIYVGNGEIIEAVADGVVRGPLDAAVKSYLVVEVYRPVGIKPAQAQAVVAYVEQQRGKAYDYKAVATAGHNSKLGAVLCMASGAACEIMDGINRYESDVKFYCSELIAHAFTIGGYSLGISAFGSTPQRVAEARGLQFVGVLKDRPQEEPRKTPPVSPFMRMR